MPTDMKQILLKGAGYSGRGVRLQVLQPAQIDAIREESAKAMPSDEDVSKEAKQAIWLSHQRTSGIAAMVVEVTERAGFTKKEDLVSAAWKKTTVDELTDSPEKYFTTKDLDALGAIYFQLHVAQQTEVDDILGEAQDVTAD
jgi:hypothetical protein